MAHSGIDDEDYGDLTDHDDSLSVDSLVLAAESPSADSPSDGYFTSRDHPRETFVQNSTVQNDSDAKAREAAERAESRPPFRTSPTTSFISSLAWPTETTPLLDAGPAPPDYAAATANRRREGHAEARSDDAALRSPSYGSIDGQATSMGTEQTGRWSPSGHQIDAPGSSPFPNFPFSSRGGPFAQARQPETMIDTAIHDAPHHGRYHGRHHGRRHHGKRSPRWRRRFVRFVVLAIAVSLFLAFIYHFMVKDSQSSHSPPSSDGEASPPSEGGDTNEPGKQDPAFTPKHPARSYCAYKHFSRTIAATFDEIDTFSLSESFESGKRRDRDISGNIYIEAAPPQQSAAVVVYISYATTQPFDVGAVHYDVQYASLGLSMQESAQAASGCLDIAIGVYLRDDVEFNDWAVSTSNLHVRIDVDVFGAGDWPDVPDMPDTQRFNVTTIRTRKGNVSVPYWSSRETTVDTGSGSLIGSFALRDRLSLHSTSGSINVKVDPREASASHPAPALFTMISSSGSISADVLMSDDIPDRDYRTNVESHSGSISGSYIHGSATSFASHSGTLSLNVLPYHAKLEGGSTLRTRSGSGTTNVNVPPPYLDKKEKEKSGLDKHKVILDNLYTTHTSTSGTLNLVYPSEWEGMIKGDTSSGSIHLDGKGVERYMDGDLGPVGKRLVARKGYGHSKLGFGSNSGSVNIKFGDYTRGLLNREKPSPCSGG